MPQQISNHHFYFDEPRLRMTLAGRVLVRVTKYVAVLVFAVATFTLLLSYDIPLFFSAGLFLLLVMLDILVHHGDGDVPISEFPKEGRINLATVMGTAAFSAIERAMDRSIITKKNFLLELASRLFELPNIENGIRSLEVKPEEFRQKLEALMADPATAPAVQGRADYAALCESLASHAFTAAVAAGHEFIDPSDLFSALAKMGDESLDRLFALFSIEEGDLDRALVFSSLHGGVMPKGRRSIRRAIRIRAAALEAMAPGTITDDEAETVLIYDAFLLERSAHIFISFGAIKRSVALAKKHEGSESLPSRAASLLKIAIADAEQRGEKIVTADRVAAVSEEKLFQS